MDEILSNPNLNSATIITSLNDSRWLGWSKLSYSRKVIDRGVEYLVEIHFNAKKINGTITLVDDFKFIVK